MPDINTLIPDIEALFEGHDLADASLLSLAEGLTGNFKDRFERYGQDRKPALYLSNVGKPLRQLWYEIKSGLPGEPLRAHKKFSFLYGDILEDLVLMLAVEAGHTVTDLQKGVEVDGVRGKIDCIIDGVVVDVKSCSSRSYAKFKDGGLATDDPFGYIAQLSGYARALGDLDAAFLAVDKVLGHMCLLKLKPEEVKEYDIHGRIKTVRHVLEQPSPPEEKCYAPVPDGVSKTAPFGNGNRTLGVGCSYCPFKKPCWSEANEGKGLRTFIYSTGPKHFTTIIPGKEPRVFEAQ